MREKTTVFSIMIFNYGFAVEFFKSKKQCNPKRKDYSSDGSIPKHMIYKSIHKYSNPYIMFHFFWNYGLLFRLFLNRA